jgi:hypothetical protein
MRSPNRWGKTMMRKTVTDDIKEALVLMIIDVGMLRRDVATDIAVALMTRPESPLVRYKERAERNAQFAGDFFRIVDQWCDLQIAHPGCIPGVDALKKRINGLPPD